MTMRTVTEGQGAVLWDRFPEEICWCCRLNLQLSLWCLAPPPSYTRLPQTGIFYILLSSCKK